MAAYFAVLEAKTDAAIWAVNWWALRDNLHAQFKLDYISRETLRDIVNQHHLTLANRFIASRSREAIPESAIHLQPTKLTDRIARQQGLFVMPTNARLPFMTNLWGVYNQETTASENPKRMTVADLRKSLNEDDRPHVIKIVLATGQHAATLKNLYKMNITSETLFGGLDGLAKSLGQTVIFDF